MSRLRPLSSFPSPVDTAALTLAVSLRYFEYHNWKLIRVTVTVDVYSNTAQTETCYTIPGPPLYSGATPSFPSLPSVRTRPHFVP